MADSKSFIPAFDSIRSGVYIATSAYRRHPAGCTVVWVSRASFDPPLLAVHLAPAGHTFQVIKQGKRFCINVLGESSLALARRFGFSSGHSEKKFDGVAYRTSGNGSPILGVAVSYIDCQLLEVLQLGDHAMVIGKVLDAAVVSDEAPMIYHPATFYPAAAQRIEALGSQAEQS